MEHSRSREFDQQPGEEQEFYKVIFEEEIIGSRMQAGTSEIYLVHGIRNYIAKVIDNGGEIFSGEEPINSGNSLIAVGSYKKEPLFIIVEHDHN